MKIKLIKKIIALISLVTAANAFAVCEKTDTLCKEVNNKVVSWMKKNAIPGVAIEIYQDGEPFSYYFGYADPEKEIPVTEKTLFEIGSITKLFTSVLLAEEVNAQKISLSDSIAEYVPDLSVSSNYFNKITLLNLATHTTGLPLTVGNETRLRAQLPGYFANWIPNKTIGSQWRYSNINTGLLGYALEASAHENINRLYRYRILKPLGMTLIGTEVPADLQQYYSLGYNVDGVLVAPIKASLFPASAAVKASGDDMQKFLKASLLLPGTPKPIADAIQMTQTAYVKTTTLSQGLGWNIYPNARKNIKILLNPQMNASIGPLNANWIDAKKIKYDPSALIDKTGGTDGFRSYIALLPNEKSGIVILSNRFVTNSEILKIGREILFNLEKWKKTKGDMYGVDDRNLR